MLSWLRPTAPRRTPLLRPNNANATDLRLEMALTENKISIAPGKWIVQVENLHTFQFPDAEKYTTEKRGWIGEVLSTYAKILVEILKTHWVRLRILSDAIAKF